MSHMENPNNTIEDHAWSLSIVKHGMMRTWDLGKCQTPAGLGHLMSLLVCPINFLLGLSKYLSYFFHLKLYM